MGPIWDQVFHDGNFCTFEQLCSVYEVPRTWRFKYAQLRQAAVAQFRRHSC